MARRPGPVSLPLDVPDSRRAARRIAVLILWAWVAAACGLAVCTVILFSLSASWFGVIPLLLAAGALLRALSLRREISAARLGSVRLMLLSDAPSSATAKSGSPQATSLSLGPDAGKHVDVDGVTNRTPTDVRFTEREPADLGLDRREADAYPSSEDEGGPGIGLWVGVGIVVLIGVVVVRGRATRAKRAEVVPDTAPVALSPGHDAPKIPQSSLGEGTPSVPSGAPGKALAATAALHPDPAGPPTSAGAASRPPRRLGRLTPSPTLARFAVIPLLASFVLAYLAIRAAGDNTMNAAIPLGLVSFMAIGAAFYLAPAS